MRTYRFALFALVFAVAQPSEAAYLFKKVFNLFKTKTDRTTLRKKSRIAGQEVFTFKLKKAKPQDLAYTLDHYLAGLGGTGFITVLEAENAIVITDFPETLARLKILIPQIDQVYTNPNEQARQMLVTQSLMKAIREQAPSLANLKGSGRGNNVGGIPKTIPGQPVGIPGISPMLSNASVGPLVTEIDEMGRDTYRRLEETYSINAFQVVGWVKDESGYTIVLNNQGNRFLFRNGRIREGYAGRGRQLPGISGTIRNMELTLQNTQGKVSLKMVKDYSR